MQLHVMCGHGAGDPGACGNGYQEAERVRALGAEIAARGGSSVTLMDTSRNWYEDKGINTYAFPADACVVELHMDSAAAGARGAHVIIKQGYDPDAYDEALAARLAAILPGRSQTIVGRDLANPNRAAKRGINYRLAEVGFISSAEDVAIFNSRMGEIADAILAAFGVGSAGGGGADGAPEPDPAPGGPTLALDGDFGYYTKLAAQEWMRAEGFYGTGLALDGEWGYWSNLALEESLRAKGFYGDGLALDGVAGRYQWLALQEFLRAKGFYGDGLSLDGVFGRYTVLAWQEFLRAKGFYN